MKVRQFSLPIRRDPIIRLIGVHLYRLIDVAKVAGSIGQRALRIQYVNMNICIYKYMYIYIYIYMFFLFFLFFILFLILFLFMNIYIYIYIKISLNMFRCFLI